VLPDAGREHRYDPPDGNPEGRDASAMPDPRRDHQERAAAAFDVDARSPRRLRLSVSEAARATHAPRSYFYEYWPSTVALGEDLALLRATSTESWQEQVRAGSHDDVFRALAEVLRADGASAGTALRCVLSAGPADSTARARLRAWDARWLIWLAGQLRAQLGDRPGVPWTGAALLTTALVEGTLLVRGPRTGGAVAGFDAAFAEQVADTAARATARFAEQVTGPDLPGEARGSDDDVLPAGATRLLARVAGAVERGTLDLHPDDHRLISPAELAEGLGVSTRWVHRCWPTPAALNADLFDEGLRRLTAAVDRSTRDAFEASTAAGGTPPDRTRSRTEDGGGLDRLPEPLAVLGMADRLERADLVARHGPAIHAWAAANEIQTAALLHTAGDHLLPPLTMVDAADLAAGAALGGSRLLAADPRLADARCTHLGEDASLLAVVAELTHLARVRPTTRPPSDPPGSAGPERSSA